MPFTTKAGRYADFLIPAVLALVALLTATALGMDKNDQPSAGSLRGAALEDAVHEEFRWNPMLDSDGIVVTVRKASVILTGEVDTWLDFNRAAQEAYEAGAAYVDNRITVRYGGENATDQGVDPSIMLWPRPESPEDRIQ